jgi:hypothetical protein
VRVVAAAARHTDKEKALDGVGIHIERTDGQVKGDKNTKPDGWALFEKLKAGSYRVSVKDLGGHKQSYEPAEYRVSVSYTGEGTEKRLPGGKDTTLELLAGDEAEVKFAVSRFVKLRIVLIDRDAKPIPDKDWELVSPLTAKGKTNPKGLIEVKNLSSKATSGILKVTMKEPSSAQAPAPTVAQPPVGGAAAPAHPPKIKPDEFKDPKPSEPAPADNIVEWKLSLSALKDFDGVPSIKARLHNLAFPCDSTSDNAKTNRAVKLYQRVHMKQENGSGVIKDIEAHIRNFHDNP